MNVTSFQEITHAYSFNLKAYTTIGCGHEWWDHSLVVDLQSTKGGKVVLNSTKRNASNKVVNRRVPISPNWVGYFWYR